MKALDQVIKQTEELQKSSVLIWAAVTALIDLQCDKDDPWIIAILEKLGDNSNGLCDLTEKLYDINSKLSKPMEISND